MRTNPTSTVTVTEFAEVVRPTLLEGLTEDERSAALTRAEREANDLARRLGIDRADGRLPAYIWAIVFAQGDG